MHNIHIAAAFFCYMLGCTAALIAMFKWRVARQKKLPTHVTFLRRPGEGLLEKMERLDGQLPLFFFIVAVFPLGLVSLLLMGLKYLPVAGQLPSLIFSLLVFIIAVMAGLFWLVKKMEEYRNHRLGYLGERFVAEQLDPLRERGCRIFHDVPRQDRGHQSNIDHVVVAPFGIYTIETKTRRKTDRSGQPDAPPDEVSFDGEKISLPHWSGIGPLEQAKHQAFWLKKYLSEKAHIQVRVMPIITFPFWSVKGGSRMPDTLHVCNPGQLWGLIPANPIQQLSQNEFDAIVRELDLLCRNVEF